MMHVDMIHFLSTTIATNKGIKQIRGDDVIVSLSEAAEFTFCLIDLDCGVWRLDAAFQNSFASILLSEL